MTIGGLAKRLDVNPRTIRYYERVGVLPEPERSHRGYRLYSEKDEARIRFIKSAQRVGLTLGEIKETLAFRERGQQPCGYVASVIERRLAEVSQRLRELRAFKAELNELRNRIHTGDLTARNDGYCHYIEAADRHAANRGAGIGRATPSTRSVG